MNILGREKLEAMVEASKAGEVPIETDTIQLLMVTALFQTQEVDRLKDGIKNASRQVSKDGRSADWSDRGIPVLQNSLDSLLDPEGFERREPVTIL